MEIPTAHDLPSDGDAVFELLLQVARRADAIDRGATESRFGQRGLWMRAELEVLEQIERSRPSLLAADWARGEPALAYG